MADPLPKMPSQTEGANRLPAKIGRYEVLEKLGSGGSGTVYKATDPFIGRILAIKTFRVDLLPGAQRDRFLQRFYHEARISGGLSHPNIVALFDVGEMDGLPYLVFEYVDGPPLDIALARAGRLDAAETIRVVEQAAAALDFAHARGVVHRDIRPANIILATDRRVRIADFGIARVEGSQLTQHGEVLGTPAYMSPEQIRGYDLSPSSDLFSLAVSAYEMLSGQRPFDGKNQAELLEALVYSPPTEPKELRSLGIPSREFMFVFERALAKDPAHRFADGASFARALKSCLGVVTASVEAIPVTRIAVPEGPLPPPNVLPPQPIPEPEPPPAPVAKKAFPPPVSLSDPQSASIDTSATASIEGGSGGPSVEAGPKFISSSDATLISTAKTEPGVRPVPAVPEPSSEETLLSTVGFAKALKAEPPPLPETLVPPTLIPGAKTEKPPVLSSATIVTSLAPSKAPATTHGSSDATMITPRSPDDSDSTMVGDADPDPPPTQRLSREAVESLLARSHSGQAAEARPTPSPILQKTQPGSEAAPLSSSGSGIEVPPTQNMPRFPVSPPLQPSARETTASKPSFTLEDMMRNAAAKQASQPPKEAEQTMVMSDTERVAAAKPRVPERSAQKVPVTPPISKPASAPPAPNPKAASRASASAASFSSSNPSGPQSAASARPSAVPKVAIGVGLLILLGVAIGAVFWGMGGSSSAVTAETWNDQPVFLEGEVEKPPSVLSSQEFPRMQLEPGRVVSVTVSWVVTPEGLVDGPKITESASPEIDAVVIETVRKWRYEPGQKDGKPVPVRVLPRRYTFPQGGSGG
jgi:TonB family protein